MLVKSEEADHIANLRETFNNLCLHQKKLNPTKYAFGITIRKLLGFMVIQHGIKVNLEKIQMIIDIRHPTFKEVQCLTG